MLAPFNVILSRFKFRFKFVAPTSTVPFDNINLLLPNNFTKSIPYDIKANPSKYIKYSMYINSEIEKLGGKPYAFIPQRNNIIQKNVIFNTSGVADLIGSEIKDFFSYKKSDITLHCKKYQSHVWSKILKLEKRSIFNDKNYVFYNQIMTDGFNCCLLFILKKYKDKEYGDKMPKPKDEDDAPKPYLSVSVSYDNIPPRIVLVSGKGKTLLIEILQ